MKCFLFSFLELPKKFVPLLLNVLNYRPLQAVPRPFLGPGRYNKCIVCLRGSAERRLNPISVSVVSPVMLTRFFVTHEQPGGMSTMNGRSAWRVFPLESFVCPSKMTSSHKGQRQPSLKTGSETGYLSPSHVWNESFNSLHPFL